MSEYRRYSKIISNVNAFYNGNIILGIQKELENRFININEIVFYLKEQAIAFHLKQNENRLIGMLTIMRKIPIYQEAFEYLPNNIGKLVSCIFEKSIKYIKDPDLILYILLIINTYNNNIYEEELSA
jgi:hypothetical protein